MHAHRRRALMQKNPTRKWTPTVVTAEGTVMAGRFGHAAPEDCRFCLDYVIECAIRLQDFDYNW